MRKTIEVDNMASFEFWVNCFKPRTKTWQKETLSRLKKGISCFESTEENNDKIKALKFILGK